MFGCILDVLVGLLGVLVGVLGTSVGVLGVLVGIHFIGIAYLISLVFGMVYLLHEMEHLIFGIYYLVISSQKLQDLHLYVV